MRVRIRKQSDEIISTQQQLNDLLLERIPDGFRQDFLHPVAISDLTPAMAGIDENVLKKAVKRILQAIEKKQNILIFGDYDCDGVTSTAVLWETLFALGVNAQPFLPHREKHGYGLSQVALDEIFAKQKPDLLITVDNGIVAHKEIDWLKEQKIDVIVTDHHEPGENLPNADSIVHTTQLSGAGVAWFLAKELLPDFAPSLLDYVTLGTVSDQIPLVGVTRSLVTYGLKVLQAGERPSLRVLAEIAGVDLSQTNMNTIHFALAPRINAIGRLYNAIDALRALVTRNPDKTRELMTKLDTVNTQRQQVTQEAVSEMKANEVTTPEDAITVVVGPYHEGIIGLLATKLVEQYSKPAIVISNQNENYKASCRSVPGVHITNILRSLPAELFLSLGGHKLAAGFSISQEKFPEMLQRLRAQASLLILPEDLEPTQFVIGELTWKLLNLETVKTLAQFEPFGAGNREPRFLLSSIQLTDIQPVGKMKNHAQVQIHSLKTKKYLKAICFQYEKNGLNQDNVSQVVIKLKVSTYRPGSVDVEIVAAL